MRSLKEKGIKELAALQNRAGRQYGLSRISKEDFEDLKHHLDAVEEIIEKMEEKETPDE